MRQWREYYHIELSNDAQTWVDANREDFISGKSAIRESTEVWEASAYKFVRVVVRVEAEFFRGIKQPTDFPVGSEPVG